MSRKLAAALCAAFVTVAWNQAQAVQLPTIDTGSSASGITLVYDSYGDDGHQTFSEKHYSWCKKKHSNYERSTNTWWTKSGKPRQCRSPYM